MVTSTWVYTPKSGTINKQIETAEKFAEIWKKYGAKEVNLYALSGAQMGNLAFTARFENAASWGSAWDEVNNAQIRRSNLLGPLGSKRRGNTAC